MDWNRVAALAAVAAVIVSIGAVAFQSHQDDLSSQLENAQKFCDSYASPDKAAKYASVTFAFSKRIANKYPGIFDVNRSAKSISEQREKIISNNLSDLIIPAHEFGQLINFFNNAITEAEEGSADADKINECLRENMVCFREKYSVRYPIFDINQKEIVAIKVFILKHNSDVLALCEFATPEFWNFEDLA